MHTCRRRQESGPWDISVKSYSDLMDQKNSPSLKQIFPHYTGKQLKEAEENLERYLALILRVLERKKSEVQAHTLTETVGTLSCTPSKLEDSSTPSKGA